MRAMILAAGLGTRMRPLTNTCPKPLLKVQGKPLIEYQVERLVSAGVTEIVINHAYLGQQIEAYLGNGEQLQAHIQYSAEPHDEPLETGGGIFKALPKLSPDGEPFLVVNGDIWIDLDYGQLVTTWQQQHQPEDLIHLVMVNNPPHNPNGDFQLTERGRLTESGSSKTTFSGVSLLHPKLFQSCQPGTFKLAPLFREAMAQNQASGQLYTGYWLDVGTPERLNELDKHIQTL